MSDASVLVAIDEAALIESLQTTCVSFFSFYLGDSLDMKVPEFHVDIWAELLMHVKKMNTPGVTHTLRKVFAVPREHSKSTIAKLAIILFLKYTPCIFGLYVTKTNGSAKNAVRDILEWLRSEAEESLHGPMIMHKKSETDSLWIFEMGVRLDASAPPIRKRCVLKAAGVLQHIRGLIIMSTRPQIIVLDDIEDLDNTTVTTQATLDEWVMGSLLKAADSRMHFILWIGNMIRKKSILARFCTMESWNPTLYGCLVRDKSTGELRPLWEGKYTVDGLLAEYREYRQMGVGHLWEAEMMNLTQEDIFAEDMSQVLRVPVPIQESLVSGFICLDPAYGLKSWHDKSAITVHARLADYNVPCIIDSSFGRWDEQGILDQLVEMSLKWGITVWCVEADAAQHLLIPLFKLLMTQMGLDINSVTIVPLYTQKKAKATRILALRAAAVSGSYGVAESEDVLVDLLGAYTPEGAVGDDELDSAAYGLIAWQVHGETVRVNGVKHNLDLSLNRNSILDNRHHRIMQGPELEVI